MRHKLAKQAEAKRLQLALIGRSAIASPRLVSAEKWTFEVSLIALSRESQDASKLGNMPQHYEKFDSRYKGLLPLKQVYVPNAYEA